MACFGTYQGRIGCYSSELGEQRWSVPASVAGGVVSDGIQLFSTESNGHVRAIDLKTGRAGWRNEDLLYRRLSSPITLSSYVIVGDVEGVISVFNSNTGEIIGRQKTDGTPIVASPIVVADKIIVQTSGGSLFAFELIQDS
jgi:outer membrane protein assembly factor BamB